jgi:hypothetical protein
LRLLVYLRIRAGLLCRQERSSSNFSGTITKKERNQENTTTAGREPKQRRRKMKIHEKA